jgi:SAM-dependent methyltransferase
MSVSVHQKGVHLSEHELLPEEAACPICAYTGNRRPVIALQRDPLVHLLECRCGCMSASRMPHAQVLSDYYSRYYSAGGSATFDGSDRFARHLFRLLSNGQKDHLRILDFGGGVDATISRSLARQFTDRGAGRVEIALVDYNASCQKDWGATTVECYHDLPKAGGGFDVVIASAVVEHIPYPRDVIVGLLKALRPQGRAYFRTPNVASIVQLAGRFGVHIDFTYPAHLHDMGQAFWENLPVSLGLQSDFSLLRSRPSIAETEFAVHPSRTAIAHVFKLPWLVLRNRYTMVGGWEAVIARTGRGGE